mgnify:FL=1
MNDVLKDAERYRWLRDNAKDIVFKGKHGDAHVYGSIDDKADDLDTAIDAVMVVQGPQMTATDVLERRNELFRKAKSPY